MRLSAPLSSSTSIRAVSSRNSGLPSAFSSASARWADGTSAPREQRVDELVALVDGQRAQLEGARAWVAAAPGRPPLQEVGSRDANDQHG